MRSRWASWSPNRSAMGEGVSDEIIRSKAQLETSLFMAQVALEATPNAPRVKPCCSTA